MEIFYLKKDEFINQIDRKTLTYFSDGRTYLSDEKYFEHLCGLFLVKFIAKHIYGLSNTEMILQGHKPIFKSGSVHFSISHSKNIVLVAFNNFPIGVDVEYMQERDFKKIMNRYEKVRKTPTKEEFYKFWTLKEAEIKLNQEIHSIFSAIFEENYLFSCVSSNTLVSNCKIKKLTFKNAVNNINLVKEFDYPKNIKITQ